MNNRVFLISIAPIYHKQPIWVEQLFDFLAIFPEAQLLLPRFSLNHITDFEVNMVIKLIEQQYPHAQYYMANIATDDINGFLDAYHLAMEKIVNYFKVEQNNVCLEMMNEEMYTMLAAQCQLLLPNEHQTSFAQLAQAIIPEIQANMIAQDTIVVLPIEHLTLVEQTLTQHENMTVYRYGDDYLDVERAEEEN